jgi:hypothetical protein
VPIANWSRIVPYLVSHRRFRDLLLEQSIVVSLGQPGTLGVLERFGASPWTAPLIRFRNDREIAEKAYRMAAERGMELPDVMRMMLIKAVRIGDFAIDQDRDAVAKPAGDRPFEAYEPRDWDPLKESLDAEAALALLSQAVADRSAWLHQGPHGVEFVARASTARARRSSQAAGRIRSKGQRGRGGWTAPPSPFPSTRSKRKPLDPSPRPTCLRNDVHTQLDPSVHGAIRRPRVTCDVTTPALVAGVESGPAPA